MRFRTRSRRLETKIPLGLSAARKEVKSEYDLSQICSMVPRLRIMEVSSEEDVKVRGKVKSGGITFGDQRSRQT